MRRTYICIPEYPVPQYLYYQPCRPLLDADKAHPMSRATRFLGNRLVPSPSLLPPAGLPSPAGGFHAPRSFPPLPLSAFPPFLVSLLSTRGGFAPDPPAIGTAGTLSATATSSALTSVFKPRSGAAVAEAAEAAGADSSVEASKAAPSVACFFGAGPASGEDERARLVVSIVSLDMMYAVCVQ
jgi:hypothetical protein